MHRCCTTMLASIELSPVAQQWVNVVLIWIGLGTVAGLLAKLILPVREPSSAAGTLVIGVLGSTAGLAVLSGMLRSTAMNPISPFGLVAACAGACALMLVYHTVHNWLLRPDAKGEE